MAFSGHCPAPRCEQKTFIGATRDEVRKRLLEHLIKNSADPTHADLTLMEGWIDPDPLGD